MRQQLFTDHDKYHIHKSLGFLCLFHYFIRLYWLVIYGNMFFNYDSIFTWITPIAHLSLSISSFIFHVPKVRFDSKIIIWKELQLHNIIFTSRSALIMLYWLCFNVYNPLNTLYPYHLIIKFFIIKGHHMIADKITDYYSVDNKTTTRDMNWENIPDIVKKYTKRFYAISQIFALNALLLGECDRSGRGFLDSSFIIMFPIQLSTFLMTLVRKSIISNKLWHVFYTMSLLSTYLLTNKAIVDNKNKLYLKIFLSLLYVVFRLYFNVNKYILMNAVMCIFIYESYITNGYDVIKEL